MTAELRGPMIEYTRNVTLTARGTATLAAYKLLAALRELDDDDRGHVLEMLRLELSELPA